MESKAKQEADRIVEKFNNSYYQDTSLSGIIHFALIHVDGIIKALKDNQVYNSAIYWQEVKQELNKML